MKKQLLLTFLMVVCSVAYATTYPVVKALAIATGASSIMASQPIDGVNAGILTSNATSICQGGSVDISHTGSMGTIGLVVFQDGVVIGSHPSLTEVESFFTTATPGLYCLYSFAYSEVPLCSNFAGFTLTQIITTCFAGQVYSVSDPLCIAVVSIPDVTQPASQVVCNNAATTAINFTSTLAGATFSWTNNTPSIGLATGGTGNIASFNAVNAGATPVTATITVTPQMSGSGSTIFNYTGAMQTFTVPAGVYSITMDAQGAQGGGTAGGLGGRSIVTLPVTPGEVLEVWVGGRPTQEVGPGGFNGGGAVVVEPCGSGPTYSWPGGGASDVRRGSGLANRIIVAGGGGGQGWTTGAGGSGGGTTGVDGATSWIGGTNGKGGTQISGGVGGLYTGNGQSSPSGTLGIGGDGSPLNTYCTGGGGGGGYYGGGGGYVSAGGGGSSYIDYPGSINTSTTSGIRSGNGIVTITYSSALCAGPPKTFTITVNPTPNAIATPASQSICSTSAITTVVLSGNVTGTVYSWTRDNTTNVTGISNTGSGDVSGNLTNTTNTAQTVIFTITPTYTNEGTPCTGTPIMATVVVSALPSISVTTPPSQCGGTINLSTAFSSNGSLSFFSDAGFSSATANPVSSSGQYFAKASVGTCTNSASVSITINPVPAASINPTTAQLCTGQNLLLSATTGPAYSWTKSGGSFTSTTAQTTLFSSTVAGGYSYTVKVSNGSCTASATASVTVVTQPSAQIAPSTTQTICQGQSLNLIASGGGPYSWSGPGNFNSTNTIASLNTSSTSYSGVYKVTVGSGVCTATATVSVQIQPSITVSVSFAPVCLVGNPLNLSASGGDEYRWRGPNSFTSTSATPTKAKTVAKDEGVYSVTVTGNGVCTVTSTIRVYYGIGTGEISITNRSPYCKGGPIILTATAVEASSYSWSKQFGTVTYTGNPVTITNNAKSSDGGVYMVFVRGENGCIEKQETLVTVSPVACIGTRMASEEAQEIDMEINAYPNPVTHMLTVEVTLKEPSKLRLQLFNSIGKESGTWQLNEEHTVHKTELDMIELTGGVYLLQAQAGKQKVVKRVVKIQY